MHPLTPCHCAADTKQQERGDGHGNVTSLQMESEGSELTPWVQLVPVPPGTESCHGR